MRLREGYFHNAPNGFLIMTKKFLQLFVRNCCMKNFSKEAIDGEAGEFQRKGMNFHYFQVLS